MPTKTYRISSSYDDVRFRQGIDGTWSIGPGVWVLEVGYQNAWNLNYGLRLRFLGVDVPKGVVVTAAYLRVYSVTDRSQTTVRSTIRGLDVDDAPPFTEEAAEMRPQFFQERGLKGNPGYCTSPVNWDNIPPFTANQWYQSPDFKNVIQTLIDRPGRVPGNAIVIYWDDFDSRSDEVNNCLREVEAWDHSETHQIELVITYEVEEGPAAGKGRLIVSAVADSEAVTASFLVNNQGPYDTPFSLDLDPNTYTVNGSYKGQTQTETVTIEEGAIETVTLRFKKYHKLTIISDPSPINITFDTEAVVTPFVRYVEAGTYTIKVPASVMVGADEYIFQQWEDGTVDPKRTVTIGSPQAVNLTATYRLKQIEGTGPITQREHKDNLRQVFGDEADISADNPLPVNIIAAGGNKKDLQQVLGQGGDLSPTNPLLADVVDRAGRLVGIIYGDLGQVLQITPADALAVANSLRTVGFPHVYDPVAGNWNRLREGAAIGQMLVDPADRWARQLGLIDLSRVLGAPLTAANPVITGIYDAAANRMPAMDAVARPGFVDVIDRAARLAGIVYGNQAQLQQVAGTLELITQDTGLNTNPERWLHDNHWEQREVTIAVAGGPGEQNLGGVVGAGLTRRIRTLIIRHAGTNNTVVTILVSGGATVITFDLAPQSTRVISAQDGWAFVNPEQPAVQSSDVTGGNTFVSAVGVEV